MHYPKALYFSVLDYIHVLLNTKESSRKAPKSAQEQERKRQSPTWCRDSRTKERKVELAAEERESRCAAETVEQRSERWREKDHARCTAQTAGEK